MRALQPVYVGCVQWLPESNEKYTPETPTPWVNGQVLTAEVPSGLPPGSYDLTVDNPGGGRTTLAQAISVAGATR